MKNFSQGILIPVSLTAQITISRLAFQKRISRKVRQKTPQHSPIIGQALLLDKDLVPLSMRMFLRNKEEKPYLRSVVEDMKNRYNVSERTVQVADKGLNCARNIYAAVKEVNDGYIFSQSVHGRNLNKKEKEWVLLEDYYANRYTAHYDENGNMEYKIKSCTDTFSYSFKETDADTGKIRKVSFSLKEKRIVSVNPALAEKQKSEIVKKIQKASSYVTYKDITREELGDSTKYISDKKAD